jgi:hypothetical protein
MSNYPSGSYIVIELFDGWYLGGPCPYCGGKSRWKRNFLHFQDDSVLDVGHFMCLKCDKKSDLHRFKLEPFEKEKT